MTEDYTRARKGIRFALLFTGILWTIEAYEYVMSANFETLGILPRTLRGSIGIVTAPLIHGDIYHLISNTFPILILVIGMFYFYHRIAPVVFFLIYFMTGFWVWIAARDAYHIGASGLVYGLISFLLFSGFIRKEPQTLAVSFVVLILYGSNMIYGLVPGNERISWESHVLGAIAGLFCAVYFKPKKAEKVLISKEKGKLRRTTFSYSDYYISENREELIYDYREKKSGVKYYYSVENDDKTEESN